MLNSIKNFSLIHLLFLSLIVRAVSFYFFGDESLVNEWAKIIHNQEVSGVFGYYVVINDYFADPKFAQNNEVVLPTVFMPPLYFYFIYVTKLISFGILNLVDLIITLQIFISLVSIFIFYELVKFFEKEQVALIAATIFSLFPLNVWVVSQISSITLQILLILLFLFFLIKFKRNKKIKNLIYFSLISGCLMLTRGEFFLFYFFTIIYFYFFLEKNFKNLILSVILTILVLSPYLYRNYNLFNELTLTKSFGYNLLKGNNPNFKVEGDAVFLENKFKRNSLKIKADQKYEINLDNFYKEKAKNFIYGDPVAYLNFYIKKVFSFIFLDLNSSYPNYYNPLHIVPKIIMSVLTLIGCIFLFKKRGFFQYLTFYYAFNILLFSIFFILPRYSLILLPVQILISISTVKFFWRKFVYKF